MRIVLGVLVVVVLAGGGAAYYSGYFTGDSPTRYRTVPIERGDLLATIEATGTVVAEEFVDVGAQINGRITRFGPEPSELKGRDPNMIDPKELAKMKHVDFNSVVHEGTLLAEIDDAVYQAQVAQAEATLQRAEADLQQLEAKRAQAEREWKRAQSLLPQKAIADTDYDLAESNWKAAEANVAVGRASIKQSQAALKLARTNLAYTVIRSPVEGTIVKRRVNIGQTVVSGLNAPSLFLIAKDLRRMQVWASVNEAEIGRIREGMSVRFKVSVDPDRTFVGKVIQVRLDATTTQTVITYTVVVEADNPDGKLLPYLTANVEFETDHRRGVLMVPAAALRWKPRDEKIATDVREAPSPDAKSRKSGPQGRPSGGEAQGRDRAEKIKPGEDRNRLWVVDGGVVRPIEVLVGATDRLMTEVSGADVKEGMEVVIGEVRNGAAEAGTARSPFLPQMRRPGR